MKLHCLSLVLGVIILGITACSSDAGTNAPPPPPPAPPPPPPPPNAPPVASAGPDQDRTRGAGVTLQGSATDPDGQTITFTWTQVSGPTVGALSGATPSFTAPNDVVTLEFEVVASDGVAQSAPDRVVIWVLEDAAQALWVSPTGADGNAGTRAAPKLTIQNAISASTAGADVYVAAGTHTQTATLSLRAGVSVYGGFSATTFLRNATANETIIAGATTAVGANEAHGLTLDGLTIRSANGTAANRSAIGIALMNSDNVVISRNRITTGNGTAGMSGTNPSLAADGGNGHTPCCDQGAAGGSGGGFPGGAGGNGGYTAQLFCTTDGTSGVTGSGPGGGVGGAGNSSDGNGAAGTDGQAGSNGAPGLSGGASFGSIAGGEYSPSTGASGASGTSGSGGGGGGGGDCRVVAFLTADEGGGGGGGGAGGAASQGSTGGGGGGGSFGIFVTSGSTATTITNNVISTGNGGAGGPGGNGASGGSAGSPGGGGNPAGDGGVGGNGGRGGNGGGGGPGAGGGGGPTIGVVEDATSSTNLTQSDLAGNTITMGSAGIGGSAAFGAGGMAPAGAAGLQKAYEKRP